jgi:hypothetical protein
VSFLAGVGVVTHVREAMLGEALGWQRSFTRQSAIALAVADEGSSGRVLGSTGTRESGLDRVRVYRVRALRFSKLLARDWFSRT